jgi:membrane-associated protease RseP (regulator of RpoE activity)
MSNEHMSETVERIPNVVVTRSPVSRGAERVTTREWLVHSLLFFLTLVTTTVAGIIIVTPELSTPDPPLVSWIDYLLYVPKIYIGSLLAVLNFALLNRQLINEGVTFSLSLLVILTAHEMGHYLACRRYRVSATLPFFIPAPPLFLAGTFGAFIKIRSAIPSRRALFDIGLAGPLAGFVFALPIAVIGILHNQPAITTGGPGIIFNDPPLFRLLAKILGVHLDPLSPPNPCYMASWIGLLVTSLNLMPVGQLDGGHGTFAVLGQRAHRLIGQLVFVTMVVLAVLGFILHGSPSGFVYCVLLAIMLKVRHPQPATMEPLGRMRVVIALITLILFALCFWPFPFTLT